MDKLPRRIEGRAMLPETEQDQKHRQELIREINRKVNKITRRPWYNQDILESYAFHYLNEMVEKNKIDEDSGNYSTRYVMFLPKSD